MKTTKRLLAVLMAVMLVIAIVPFTVSAATEATSFTVTCDKPGFTFNIYQAATLDTETGHYTAVINTEDVKAALAKDSQAIIAACNKAADAELGEAVATFTSSEETKELTVSGEKIVSGLYFVKCVDKPSTVKKVGSSLIANPVYDSAAKEWKTLTDKVDVGIKVEDGDAKVSKKIVDSKFTDSHTTAAFNEDVTFELKASVVGSKDEKLNAYAITDTHTKALKFKEVKSVKLVSDAGEKVLEEADWTRSNESETGFQIDLSKDTVLSTDEFYTYDNVVVTYDATLTEEAVIGNPGNPNSDGLVWKNSADKEDSRDGNTVYVFTFQIDVNKVDANDKTKKLEGVEFGLYTSEENAKNDTDGVKVKTDKDGVISYKGLDKGTYYIKETATITGYNLNTKIYSVEIVPEFSNDELTAPVDGTVSTTIANTPAAAPKTGMESTMTFTFVGAGLVILSAGLFIVAMRKRAK